MLKTMSSVIELDLPQDTIVDCRSFFQVNPAQDDPDRAPLPATQSVQTMQGLSGLSDVVASLERRFAGGVIPDLESDEEEVIEEVAEGDQPKKKKKKKRKATKEEQEWLDEGKGFLDDTEAKDDVKRLKANASSNLKFKGFYIFRGPLQKPKDSDKNGNSKNLKRKRSGGEQGFSDGEDFESQLPWAITKPLRRLKSVLAEYPDGVPQELSPTLDSAITILDRTMRKNVEGFATNTSYISLLLELLKLDEDRLQTHLDRIRLMVRCKWLNNSYNKSMTELRKWAKPQLQALPEVEKRKHNGNPTYWMDKLGVLQTQGILTKGSKEVYDCLTELYKVAFSEAEKRTKSKNLNWEKVLSRCTGIMEKLNVRKLQEGAPEDDAKYLRLAKEQCALCLGLLHRTNEGKKSFKWDAEGKKILKQIGMTHRKLAIQTVKLRNLEVECLGVVRSGCRTRASALKHICDIFPARYIKVEELKALTVGSTTRLPHDEKLIPPEGSSSPQKKRKLLTSPEKSKSPTKKLKAKKSTPNNNSKNKTTTPKKSKKTKSTPNKKGKGSATKAKGSGVKAKQKKAGGKQAARKKSGSASPKKQKKAVKRKLEVDPLGEGHPFRGFEFDEVLRFNKKDFPPPKKK